MSPRPLILGLDGTTTPVTEQVKFFELAKDVTRPTSILLRYVNFNHSAVRSAAIGLFRAHQKVNREEEEEEDEEEEESSSIPSSSSARFKHLSLWECPESPFLEVALATAVRSNLFQSITVKGPTTSYPLRTGYVSMLPFDERRGGFPSRLDRLILDSITLTERDAGFLAGALRKNCNGDGDRHNNCNANWGCHARGLRHLTIRNIHMGHPAFLTLCEGLRWNKSLRMVDVIPEGFWLPARLKLFLESLSDNPQLTSIHVSSIFLSTWMEIIPTLSLAKNVQFLQLSLKDRMVDSKDASTVARHVLCLMLLSHSRLSNIHIDSVHCPEGITTTTTTTTTNMAMPYVCDNIPPELVHKIRHMADLNYAGRSLLMEGRGSDSEGTYGTITTAAATRAVPMGLWPLLLGRLTLQRPWPSVVESDPVAWGPSNKYNGIYHILRWGPALLHRGGPTISTER